MRLVLDDLNDLNWYMRINSRESSWLEKSQKCDKRLFNESFSRNLIVNLKLLKNRICKIGVEIVFLQTFQWEFTIHIGDLHKLECKFLFGIWRRIWLWCKGRSRSWRLWLTDKVGRAHSTRGTVELNICHHSVALVRYFGRYLLLLRSLMFQRLFGLQNKIRLVYYK